MRPNLKLVIAAALSLSVAGCGSPPSQTGAFGDMPVQAVVAAVRQQPIEEKIALVGNLEAREWVELKSEVEARVTGIEFNEGDNVRAGQVLFRLDAAKLEAAVAESRARFDLARHDFERGQSLVQKKTISVQQFDQFRSALEGSRAELRHAEEQLNDAIITAPFSGRTGDRRVSPGQYVDRGAVLSTLVQVDPLEVEFNVPERFVGQIAIGQRIEVTTAAYPRERFGGEVFFMSPRLDAQSRTLPVKATIPNADGRLKPGMFANLELVFRARDDALVIPEAALSYRGDNASVVVVNGQSRAEMRAVTVGLRTGGMAEVTDGLKPGERVVVEGLQKIGPGSRINVSPDSARYGVTPPQDAARG
ncbi:MAG: efflux RND transporter periplasmic adaptor subunit [Gammaproteobacteria bacterium]